MPAAPVQSTILAFADARRVVEEQSAHLRAHEVESVELLTSAGRVLAEPVVADRDIPPFPRSTRDGYAVRSADLAVLPAKLTAIGEIRAGESAETIPPKIASGQAVGIMTGAPVPEGADAVVMIEFTSEKHGLVEITKRVEPGENIVPRGAEARKSSALLLKGMRLNDAAVALAASAGQPRLSVYKRPQAAILSTGDEIVDIDKKPRATQIRNSNSYSLAVQVQGTGGEPVVLPIAPDEPQKLKALIEDGLRADLLLMTGGVSMGRYDLVEQVLSEIGAEFFFTGAKIQPGRPVVFGKARGKYFFGLPGNPVSTMVTFELFVTPILEALAGMTPRPLQFLHARAKSEIRVKPGLTRFLPALLSGEFESTQVELVAWQGSGDIAATALSNCYAVIAPERERIEAGDWVPVLPR